MTMHWSTLALAAALCTGAPAADPPIVVRHDMDDETAFRLGRKYGAGAVEIVLPRRTAPAERVPIGMGTLIGERWVLTAAHIAAAISPARPRSGRTGYGRNVRVNGRDIQVRRIVLHPDWVDMGPYDIALIELAEPVTNVAPVALYEGRDEMGRLVTLAGTGIAGTGLTGPTVRDRRLRGATNRIDRVREDYLAFTFDAPGSRRATEHEGISGPGDSGGPAFIERGGVRYVAGVSSRQVSGSIGEGRYGVEERYTRVSTFAAWLRGVMERGR
ncbi:MAG TPA: trypsin-like serine protease [Longimicrobiaceae bacterium]|nr:trypsin-like serine protease [Longimicrobiaceae bacterium]